MSLFGDDTDPGQGPPPEDTANQDPGSNQQQTEPEYVYSPFAQNYLQQVPEAERELVARHLKTWDGNVTRQFQQLQGNLRPYRELGEPDELRSAKQLMEHFRQNPGEVAKYLIENGYYDISQHQGPAQTPGQAPVGNQPPAGEQQDPYAPRFQQYDTQLKQQQAVLAQVANFVKEQREAQEKAQADAQLDEWLTSFRKTYPGVDEQYALTMMGAGVADPQQIAQRWQDMIQQQLNQRAAQKPPNVMGSGSQPPVATDVATYSKDQRQQALDRAIFGGQ